MSKELWKFVNKLIVGQKPRVKKFDLHIYITYIIIIFKKDTVFRKLNIWNKYFFTKIMDKISKENILQL